MSIFSDNTGFTPVPGFNFLLRVEMAFDVPVKSVRAFTKNFEYEYIQEGGLNDYVHMRRKPISQPFTLEIERYAATDLYYDPLQNGTELMLPLLLMVSPYQGMFSGYSRRTYIFTGCTVTGKEYGALDSEKSGLMTETIKIAYRQVAVIDIPETIAAEPNKYTKALFAAEKEQKEAEMLKEVYGRQVDDAGFKTIKDNYEAKEKQRSEVTDPEKRKTLKLDENAPRGFKTGYGKFDGKQSAHHVFDYREGEINRGDPVEKKKENERYYKTGYGKFDGPTSSDKKTYIAGEIGAAPDANKRETFHPKYGEFSKNKEDFSSRYITYMDGEIENAPKANERFYFNSEEQTDENGKKKTVTKIGDESYYGKEVLEQYKKAAKENPPKERIYKKSYGKFDGDKSADNFTYLAKETGSAPDANERTYPKTESYYGKEIAEKYKKNAKGKPRNWPKDESYYGKDVAQKYKSSAKNNARSWPKTESYYGKATLESIAKKAKKNERKWPPTESAFGLNQMKNNNKGKK